MLMFARLYQITICAVRVPLRKDSSLIPTKIQLIHAKIYRCFTRRFIVDSREDSWLIHAKIRHWFTPTFIVASHKFDLCLDCFQEDLKSALLESLADLDPANPWVKDSSGRHTNVSALLDWPEEEDESENESETMESTELSSEAERKSICRLRKDYVFELVCSSACVFQSWMALLVHISRLIWI